MGTITEKKTISETVQSQWMMYERFLNYHSALARILGIFEEGKNPACEMPKIMVEETPFDACYHLYSIDNGLKEGFVSLYSKTPDIDQEKIKRLNNNSLFSSIHHNIDGYSIIYIYPLTDHHLIKGFVVLGKKANVDDEKDIISTKEVDIICNFYNKLCNVILPKTLESATDEGILPAEFSLSKHFPYPLIFTDNIGKIIYINEKAKMILPIDRYSLMGVHIEDVLRGIRFADLDKENIKDKELQFKNGDRHYIYGIDTYPVFNATGDILYRGIILKDITELKLIHEEALFREKLETLGMLAAGIAHDFNNMLTGILGYASMLKSSLNENEMLLKYTEVIERSAGRAASLTKRLLNFAKKQQRPSSEFDLHLVIEDSLLLFCESLKGIEIEKDLSASQVLMKGEESELQHIFLNLFINSKEAMEGKGILRVSTKNLSIGNKEYIQVIVEDTGKGIDEATRANLFKPHCSTKGTRSNLGIGLYRIEKTTKKYGGFIEVESEKNKGTKFFVYLPRNNELKDSIVTVGEKKKEVKTQMYRKRILVVDDEEFIGEMFTIVAEKIGVDVVYCNNGHDALGYIKDNKFDCIVLDIIMPGKKGDELLADIRQMRIDANVIISSGYMSEDQRDKVKMLGVKHFLDKPFTNQKMLDVLESVLNN
ncbi:MAG TPA: response regulator [Syntrophorhabdaceae bacterium]|nr:response regulator [Syntrophorhabdaceae bacterium]HQJ94159.1 response regulator [Syntrophorhabdaceae bacterium]